MFFVTGTYKEVMRHPNFFYPILPYLPSCPIICRATTCLSLFLESESTMATRTNKRNAGTRSTRPANPPKSPVGTRLIASAPTAPDSSLFTSTVSARTGAHKKNTGKPRRLHQRFAYMLRHPVDASWGWLSSVRTAILLIAAITIICLLGIYFVQAPGETLNDPASYAAWIQQNALPRYGSLTPVFNFLQFFTIF